MEAAGLLLRDRGNPPSHASAGRQSLAWRSLGHFGWMLALAGLLDLALLWYPLGFGNAGWEFATADRSFSAVPLVTVGLAAALTAAWGRAQMLRVRVIAVLMIAAAVVMAGCYVLFLLNAPIALQMAGEASMGVKKAIVKTSGLALVFTAGYFAVSISALRTLSSVGKAGSNE